MKNSQIFEALKSLSKTEFNEFGKFVRSPYHNNRSEVVRLYDAIKKFYPLFESKSLTEEKIFKKVYPGKKFSVNMITKAISLTQKLLMDFYAIGSFKENNLDYNVKLLYTLYEKNLPALFKKKAKSIEELLKKSKHTVEYYEAKSKYTSWITAHLVNINESATVGKYQHELDDFVEYFLIAMLIQYHRLITYSHMYNIKYDLKFFNEIMDFLNLRDYKEVTLVSLYHTLVMLTSTEEEKYFVELLNFWEKFEDKLNDLQQHIIYVTLYNHCINRKHKGETKYHELQFEITKKYFGKNIFPKDVGHIQANLFNAAIINAAKQKEFSWSVDFINNYRERLDPETAEETINFSFATIEFEKGNYEKSLSYLSTVNPERIIRKLNVKNLLIMSYYELGYTEELIASIDSYKHYLHREKDVTPQYLQMNSHFLKFVSGLNMLRVNGSSEDFIKLKKEIEDTVYFNHKEWLLEKAEELGK